MDSIAVFFLGLTTIDNATTALINAVDDASPRCVIKQGLYDWSMLSQIPWSAPYFGTLEHTSGFWNSMRCAQSLGEEKLS